MKIGDMFPAYLKHLRVLGRSPYTIRIKKYHLKWFKRYLDRESVTEIENLTVEVLEDYQQELAFHITPKGSLLSIRSQVSILCSVRGFTKYLKQQDYLVNDPGTRIQLPKEPKRLPRMIMSEEEVKKLLNAPDMRTNQGYRDRVILEILYDTGIRRAELANLQMNDLDLNAGYTRIHGKGDKERVVPLSTRCCTLIRNYLLCVRPHYVGRDKTNPHLILSRYGEKMNERSVWLAVKRSVKTSGINKKVSTHTFRHTCATHMLRNGAPVRHLQEMLGHSSLESTQIYTHVTINDLKKIHSKYHPAEKMEQQ